MRIRCETAEDHAAILRVVQAAFGRALEARLVEAVWASDRTAFGFVAEDDEEIVGHVLVSYIDVHPSEARVLQIAPLAVVPARQRRGIGSALMRAALNEAERLGAPVVLVEGDPAYYERFGFRAASDAGLRAPDGTPEQYFMAKKLAADTEVPQGTVVYPPAFRVT